MSRTTKNPPVGERWESPPDVQRPDWDEVARTLRKSPMKWLRVYSHGRETWANAITRGRIAAMHPSRGIEVKTTDNTRTSPRTCTLFARFNPEKKEN